MNDIGHVYLKSKVIMFANDLVLVQSHLNPVSAVEYLKADLVKITEYFTGLKLSLKKGKTKLKC